MVLNENSHIIFRANKNIILKSIELDPASYVFACDIKDFSEEERDFIKRLFMENNPPILLNEHSFTFLKSDSDYLRFSMEHADESNIAQVLRAPDPSLFSLEDTREVIWKYVEEGKLKLSDTKNPSLLSAMFKEHEFIGDILKRDFAAIKYIKYDLLSFSREDQERIYQIFKRNEEELSTDPEIMQLMMKNSLYVIDYLQAHPEEIQNVNLGGLKFSEDEKTIIKNYYLQNNIQVNEKTPKFLRDDKQFVYQYIMQNNGELRGLSLDDVAPLLTFSEVKRHPEYRNLSKFYEQIDLGYSAYIQNWGEEKTFEVGSQVGDLIRFMNPNQEPSVESLKNDFLMLLQNRSNLKSEEVIEVVTTLELELPKDFFQVHSELTVSDILFDFLIQKDPSQIRYYTGNNQGLLVKAIDSGAELTEELLQKNNFRTNDAVFRKVLEQKPELFKCYKGSTIETILLAYDKGYFSRKTPFELEEIFKSNNTYTNNSELFERLISEYGAEIGYNYTGNDDRIFERLINDGFFDGLTEEDVIKVLREKGNFRNNTQIILHLLDNYSVDIIEEYQGSNEEVFKKAIEKGLVVDISLFERRPELVYVQALIDEGAKRDKYCNGLKISGLARDIESNKGEILSIIKTIIGEEEFSQIVNTAEREEAIINLCTISNSPMVGISLLRSMNKDFISELGFDEWKKFIKYTFNNPSAKYMLEIINSGQIKDFMSIYKSLEGYYQDKQAYGIDELLKFSELYYVNPELLKLLSQKAKTDQGLSEVEQMDLYMILYSSDKMLKEEATIADIGKLTEREAAKRLERLPGAYGTEIKDDLFTFLLGMDSRDVGNLLKLDIDSQTLIRVINRARKDSNKQLEMDSRSLLVLVDLIEQIQYSEAPGDELSKFAQNVYMQDPMMLAQIRRAFSNVREKVRQFYEKDAQSELTNVQALMENPEFVEKDGEDIIVDLSRTRHALYAHVLGTSVSEFFNTDLGKVTICVSPVTDQHEAYFTSGGKVIIGFDTLPEGSFIGSAPENMDSNGSISENDYDIERVRKRFQQTGIRESYNDRGEFTAGHGETLLYRYGLIPSCVIIYGENPTDEERKIRKEIEEEVNKGKSLDDPEYRKIPFVRTQREQNRVFAYEKELPKEMIETEVGTMQEQRVDTLRKLFSNVFGFGSESFLRTSTRGEKYFVSGEDVFTLIDDYTQREIGAMKAGQKLQTIVYGEDSDLPMDIREFRDESSRVPSNHIGIKDINARSLWQYSRRNSKFAHTTNSILLKEFLVDHLLCNYQVGNTNYDLDIDGRIFGRNKRDSGKAVDDFIANDGSVYTSMSYLYFDSQSGNNLYRKVFEDYISTSNPDRVFSREDFDEFIEMSDKIAKMDEDSYIGIFTEMLDAIDDQEEREKVKKVLLERKKNLREDSREFVDRVQTLRKIEQNPEVIENPDSVAFINDIHGNLEALEALLEECEKTGKKDIFILGDMIGFGPQCNECLDLLRQKSDKFNFRCILGNHELYSIMGNKSFLVGYQSEFQEETTSKIRKDLSPENRKFIESMPLTRKAVIGGKKIEFTHFPINKDFYSDRNMYLEHGEGREAFGKSANGKDQDAVIYGHEHRTESTMGDDIGTIGTTTIGETEFINLPSSGCVHGKNTSLVTIAIQDDKIVTEAHTVSYEREKLEEALKTTKNPNAHFFGGIRGDE